MGSDSVNLTTVQSTITDFQATNTNILHEIYERVMFINKRLEKLEQALGTDYIADAGYTYEETGDTMEAYSIFHASG